MSDVIVFRTCKACGSAENRRASETRCDCGVDYEPGTLPAPFTVFVGDELPDVPRDTGLTDAETDERNRLLALVMLPTLTAREREVAVLVWRAARRQLAEQFHRHLDVCQQCRDNPFALCTVGTFLLARTEAP